MHYLRNIGLSLLCLAFGLTSVRASVLAEDFAFSGAAYTVTGEFTYDSGTKFLQSISGSVETSGTSGADTIGGLVTGTEVTVSLNPLQPFPNHTFNFAPQDSMGNSFYFDNVFAPSAGGFSFYGVLFSFGSGNYGNLYVSGGVAGLSVWLPDGPLTQADPCTGGAYCPGDVGTLTMSAVPELPTWALMLAGFFALALLKLMMARQLRGCLAPNRRLRGSCRKFPNSPKGSVTKASC